ncbi:hypothetical protein HAX54_000498, partial [Datura stramonium]|nr:hypothetical protein [Datura stramonium]
LRRSVRIRRSGGISGEGEVDGGSGCVKNGEGEAGFAGVSGEERNSAAGSGVVHRRGRGRGKDREVWRLLFSVGGGGATGRRVREIWWLSVFFRLGVVVTVVRDGDREEAGV